MQKPASVRYPARYRTASWAILSGLVWLISIQGIRAQSSVEHLLKGVVRAKDGDVLPGSSVVFKGQTRGTSTDGNGAFSLDVKAADVLVVSAIGYQSTEVTVGNQSSIIVTLNESASQLNEVVIVGYGTQDRKDLVGAVSQVNADEIKNRPVASFDQQLQGRAAGVQVAANTGVPGDGIFFRIRGTTSINASNDPLYVVDGVFVNNQSLQKITTQGQANNPLADINPADIESISILKDAEATAIYGARAANGVVLITTKRGAYNSKPKVSLNLSGGQAWAPKLWDLVTGPEHATIINEAWINDGKSAATRPFRPKSEGGRGLPEEQPIYDRLGDIFRTGALQNYDLSVAGGNANTRYYIGGGYTSQQATLRTNDFNRASFKLNLDQDITDRIKIGTSNILSQSKRTNARVGDGPQGGILQAALHTPTYLPKFNDDGTYAKWAGFDNLDVLINNTDMHSISTRYIGNIYGEYEIIKGLKLRSSWSLDYNNYDEYEYWNTLTNRGSASKGLATSSISTNTIWINEQTLNYRRAFGSQHTFSALLGNTLQGNVSTQTFAQGTNFPSDAFRQIASASVTTASSNRYAYNLTSFFGRVDYSFARKYFLEASLRADASSKFAEGKRWGYFPSVGVAWQLKQENFLKDVGFLSDLKLRASVGYTGNQNGIDNYAARGLWGGGFNYQDSPGTFPVQLANPNLKWETTRQANIGLNIGLLNNRIGLELNAYHKYTYDLLLQVPLAQSSGFASIYQNNGAVSNRGLEFAVNSLNINRGGLQWNTSFNIATNINRIEQLSIPVDASYSAERMQQGQPFHAFYVYKQLYVDPQTGNAVYEDVNKDGQITANDRQFYGSALPTLFGGLNNTLSYKGFDLSVFFNFQTGNKVYNSNRFFQESGGTRDERRAINKNQLNRWQKPGDITDVPRVTTIGTNYNLSPISRFVEDGSFLRLNSLVIGYTIPKAILNRIGIASARVYYSGSNLWLLSRYQGPDPEVNVTANPTTQGYDLGTPPQPRTAQFGLNITL
ncbi:TonB-linked SusC/RagA family outer membrane protein [Spirosoma oryzae]|uniref:TonB-linked SusC/RagA family outer membrane protein n=1 Tax=Spirosoma oryzae TaxID=1469603 RepID=A0A2T0T331_9BACT|nr:TonB-dependent receptor [Spirosoma oryzae]PRY40039.1 TonB-linked SusC/RagA family outer membrane protein [Spirosoma oryzae]